jgi:predicted MFS family arabinose efflux permease
MEGALLVLMMIVVVGIGLCLGGIPGYVLAKRRGLRNPMVAFVPFVGLSIVLFESIGRSGWLAMLSFIPYIGWFGVPLWTGIEMPAHHGRTRWWTAILAVPLLNLVGYWAYAFTLPKHVSPSELQGVAA